MKIVDLLKVAGKVRLSPLKSRVLDYLESHPDEVFPYRDEALATKVKAKPSALSFTLWALHRDGLVGKEKAGGKSYFGAFKAIEELRLQKGLIIGKTKATEDPFQRARANMEKIRAKGGNVNVLELLDEVRGARE